MRSTGFWRSGGSKVIATLLFIAFMYAGFQHDYRAVIALALVIVLVETM